MTARALVAKVGREAARKAARHALWRAGDLSWALHADQLAARAQMRDAETRGERRFVFLCGRRWGKTRFFVVDAFEYCLQHPGSVIPYAALTMESARDFVFPEARILIESAPDDDKPELVDGEVRFRNGSILRIAGSETELSANRLRGKAAPRAYMDEAGFNPVLVYVVESVLAWTMATTDGSLVMGSSPPLSPSHPFWARYAAAAASRGTLTRRKTSDAPHIKPHVLQKMCEDMGGPTSAEWRREGECEVLTDEERAVIPEWGSHAYAVAPASPKDWPTRTHRHWYVAADLGYSDGTAIGLAWHDFDTDTIVVEDERVLGKPTSSDVQAASVEMERAHVPEGQHVVSRVADAALMTIADLHKLQPTEEENRRWRMTQKDDLQAAVNALRVSVARHRILIHPRCVTIRAHMEFAIWNKTRTAFERQPDEKLLRHFDALAMMVYLVRSVRRTENPYPPAPRPSKVDRWVPQADARPPNRIPRGGPR